MKCNQCNFYKPEDDIHGTCVCPKFHTGYGFSYVEYEDAQLKSIEPDCVVTEDDEGWGFYVGSDFGCIHFELRINELIDSLTDFKKRRSDAISKIDKSVIDDYKDRAVEKGYDPDENAELDFKLNIAIKRFCIFWIETKREIHSGDDYHVLGTLMGIFDTQEEAETEVGKMNLKPTDIVTIIPTYSNKIV